MLELRHVHVALRDRRGGVPLVRDVSFSLLKGERRGVAGESGCGKSLTALAVMGLLPMRQMNIAGEILLDGRNLLEASEAEMEAIRGRRMSMIFQEPMSALDPVFTIGFQIAETVRRHFRVSAKEARERAIAALDTVGIAEPARRYDSYPHQLSGGMRQRAMIAIALVCEPDLLIADEPTTALDVTIQAQIMDLILALSERTGTALLLITHDLALLAGTCDRMMTMYAGEVVEEAPVGDMLSRPRHPYTHGLLRSLPQLSPRRAHLPTIRGTVPSPGAMPPGCRFEPRCEYAVDACERAQVLFDAGDGRRVRCVRHDTLALAGVEQET